MEKMDDSQTTGELKDTDKFPCTSCGGNMVFDPENGGLSCPYCGNHTVISRNNNEIKEYDFDSEIENHRGDWGSKTSVIKCESCGAETVLDAYNVAQFCAFCGSSHIVKQDCSAGIVPESVVPFKVSQKTAMELFRKWISKRYFAPRALKTNYSAQRLKGVYIPFWTYDTQTFSRYTGEGGTYYYVTETYTTVENGKTVRKTRQVRKIRWWPTSGNYSRFFDDVLVNASKQIDSKLIGRIEPFALEELVGYKPEYLSGFFAEHYSVGLKDGWTTARKWIDDQIREGVIRKINADEVRNLHIRSCYEDIKYKHLLLPLWISSYTYKNKIYKFMINGQTGKVSGYSPVSPWKVLLAIGVGAAVAVLAYLIFRNRGY